MSPSVMNITPDDSSDSDFSEQHRGSVMPIAVIGLGFRGPGEASSIEGLWSMMKEKREAWSPVPSDRWNHEAFYHPDSNRNGTVGQPVSKLRGSVLTLELDKRHRRPFYQTGPIKVRGTILLYDTG
jgi:hypothetical protein